MHGVIHARLRSTWEKREGGGGWVTRIHYACFLIPTYAMCTASTRPRHDIIHIHRHLDWISMRFYFRSQFGENEDDSVDKRNVPGLDSNIFNSFVSFRSCCECETRRHRTQHWLIGFIVRIRWERATFSRCHSLSMRALRAKRFFASSFFVLFYFPRELLNKYKF